MPNESHPSHYKMSRFIMFFGCDPSTTNQAVKKVLPHFYCTSWLEMFLRWPSNRILGQTFCVLDVLCDPFSSPLLRINSWTTSIIRHCCHICNQQWRFFNSKQRVLWLHVKDILIYKLRDYNNGLVSHIFWCS